MIKNPTAMLTAAGLALLILPTAATAATLTLPADARVAVQVIDDLLLGDDSDRRDDILMRPVSDDADATHELPEYCVLVGNARLDGERLRITASYLTCIEAEGGDSEIFSGEISAAAYEADGSYGVDACQEGRCELTPAHVFQLQLASELAIEEQENPAEQINIQRRQAEGTGVANPLPAERPTPNGD
ncbi:hypothetical protein HOP52_01285 [Halomonas campisalis]|uniref:Uncharacterized protein n=1 Tax=Billgrantia campisalis TaxID=74661 RepID=A0ABS9P3Q2_9GAMM|nr:hypothetical protein [Halomonas campisalis]MCG6656412.1 hypothetical protein [Halomonas campisalis]MDR5861598.1 hypothetical protein [Halomonas campisalis]